MRLNKDYAMYLPITQFVVGVNEVQSGGVNTLQNRSDIRQSIHMVCASMGKVK